MGYSIRVGSGIFINLNSAKGCTGKAETQAFNKAIFRSFLYSKIAAFELIVEVFLGYRIPFDSSTLAFRYDVSLGCIHFLKSIGLMTGDKNVIKGCYTVFIGYGIFINSKTAKRSTVKVELHTFYQAILGILNYLQIATLQHVVKGNGSHLITHYHNVACFLRLILVFHSFLDLICARFQIVDLNRTVHISGYGLIDTVACEGESDALYNTIFRRFYDLCGAGICFVDSINPYQTIVICIDRHCPFRFSVCVIIGRKYRLFYGIGAVRNGILGLGITTAVSRTDFIGFSCFGIGRYKDCAGKVLAVGIFLIYLDIAVRLKDFLRQMKIGVRIRGLITGLSHPVYTGDLRTSIITNVDDIIHTFVGAGVHSNVSVRVFGCTEDNQVARSQLTSIHIGRTGTDFFNLTFVGKFVQCSLPSDNCLRVHSRCVNSITDKLGVRSLNVRQVIHNIIADKSSTT